MSRKPSRVQTDLFQRWRNRAFHPNHEDHREKPDNDPLAEMPPGWACPLNRTQPSHGSGLTLQQSNTLAISVYAAVPHAGVLILEFAYLEKNCVTPGQHSHIMTIKLFIQQGEVNPLFNFQVQMPVVPAVGDLLNLTSMSPFIGIKDKLEMESLKIQYVKVTQIEYAFEVEWIAKVYTQAVLNAG